MFGDFVVLTILTNENGAIEFENGSLVLIGTKNVEDINEVTQAVRLGLLTQKGEDLWNFLFGLDHERIFNRWIDDPEADYIVEEVIRLNIVEYLQQFETIADFPRRMEVEENKDIKRTYNLIINFTTLNQNQNEFKTRIAIPGGL